MPNFALFNLVREAKPYVGYFAKEAFGHYISIPCLVMRISSMPGAMGMNIFI